MEIDPLYLKAIEQLENERDLSQQVTFFPYLDKSCCWDPDAFFKENMIAIKEGYFGQKLEDRLCGWLAHGRMGLLHEGNGLYMAIRYLDQEQCIYWRILNIRHLPFDISVYLPKTKEEIVLEKAMQEKKLQKALDYMIDDDNEDNEDKNISIDINPFKKINLVKVMKKSILTKRFYGQLFKPTFNDLDDQSILNTFCGFRWTRSEIEEELLEYDYKTVEERVTLIRNHLLDVVCNGHESSFSYLLSWMVKLYTTPWEKMHTMIIFIGKQGSGKGITMSIFGKWFGVHYNRITTLKDLIGQFNTQANNTILAFADEVSIKKGSKEEEKLKIIITEEKGALRLEKKGKNTSYEDNYVNLVGSIDTLDNFQVDLSERRYFPLYFNNTYAGSKDYFDRLSLAIDTNGDCLGSKAFLLWALDHVDLTGFGKGQNMPETKELSISDASQYFNTKNIFEEFICKMIERGYTIPRDALDDDLLENNKEDWIDSQGRNTDKSNWVCEVPSTLLYKNFKRDMQVKIADSAIKQGLSKYLRPECFRKDGVRRRKIFCKSPTGKIYEARRSYITFFKCEEYMRMFGMEENMGAPKRKVDQISE